MLLYLIRHGDPIYEPDSLTELGEKQAEALSKRLEILGFDKVFVSSSERAILTAKPTCEKIGIEPTVLDWCNEKYAFEEFTAEDQNGKRNWVFSLKETRKLLSSSEIVNLGKDWYKSPKLEGTKYHEGIMRISKNADEFLANLGYVHNREENNYKVVNHSDQRIALFAHCGFGLAFLSAVLDIPYPMLAMRFYIQHSGVTVIEFNDLDSISIPRVFQLSNDSHLYKENLPTKYMNRIDI